MQTAFLFSVNFLCGLILGLCGISLSRQPLKYCCFAIPVVIITVALAEVIFKS